MKIEKINLKETLIFKYLLNTKLQVIQAGVPQSPSPQKSFNCRYFQDFIIRFFVPVQGQVYNE